MCVERADRNDQNHRRAEQPRDRREGAERPAAENHCEVHHVAAGQEGAKASLNCSAVNQRRRSTMIRRAQASTPPKPDSDIAAKAVNSSAIVGRGAAAVGVFGAGAGRGRADWLGNSSKSSNPQRFFRPAEQLYSERRSFFGNHLRLYSLVPAQAGYGDKWLS